MHDTIDHRREPIQRIGLFVEVLVPVIVALDGGAGVTQDSLGVLASNASATQQASRGSPQIVQAAVASAAQPVEGRLG